MSAVRKELKMSESVESLEPRVVRIEANVAHLLAQNTEIKTDLRTLNTKVDTLRDKLDERFTSILEKLGELKVWAIIVIGGGVLSIIARAFHWI